MSEIILVKLGGSVITHKDQDMSVRREVLTRLVGEVAESIPELKQDDIKLIIGHGQGSFAHIPAKKYRTIEGFINEESPFGMAMTQHSAANLNRIVVGEFLNQGLPAVSAPMSGNVVTKDGDFLSWNGDVLLEYLEKNMLPVTGGDVLVDEAKGCTIWSTEKVFEFLANWLPENSSHKILKIIHVTQVDGVLDAEGKTVPEISMKNKDEVKKLMTETQGTDVTGGMWHKIEESLELAKNGINSVIISGLEPNNLKKALLSRAVKGTRISA